MADYSKTTNFTAKDALPTGNPSKTILGSEHDTEYTNIQTAIATKANKTGAPATTNNLAMLTATGDLADSLVETDGAGNITANVTGNLTGDVTGNADTATALATGRTISLTGQATGTSGSFDGTGNVSITASLNESITASGTWSITTTSTQVLPAGIVNFVLTAGGGTLYLELYVSGSWRRTNVAIYSGTVFSDGTNMRLYSTPSTATVYYQVW